MIEYVTSRELAEVVRGRVSYNVTQAMLAKEFGVSQSYLSDFLAGKREAGPRILKALGYNDTPHYTKAKP